MMPLCRHGLSDRYKDGRCRPCTRASNKSYRDKNKDSEKERKQAWEKENKSLVLLQKEKWRQKNRESCRISARRRRNTKYNAQGSHTHLEFLSVCDKQNWKCASCRKVKELTEDHIVPLSRGGSDWIWNIQALCKSCNSIKGTRLIDNRVLVAA